MTDASPASLASVSVGITTDLSPLQAKLDQAQAMLVAWDARMASLMSGSGAGASSALSSVNASAARTATVLNTVTAPAAAATAKIDALGEAAVVAATGVDTSGISAKALAAALAATGNNLEKATALMVANADAAKAQAAATDTATAATAALADVQGKAGAAGAAGALAQTTTAAKALDTELANTTKLSAGASAEILRIGNDAARGNFGRLTSAAVVLSTRLGEDGASALTFRNVLSTFGGLADVVFNPIFIALVGIPLALDLAVKGFEALSNGGKSLNDVLKEQKDYLSQLAQSYPDAAKAAQDYLKIASGQSAAQAAQSGFQSTVDLQNQQNAARQSIEEQLRSALNPAGNGPDLAAQARDADVAFGDLSGHLRQLLQDFVAGKEDAAQLSTALANMYATASPQEQGVISQFETWLATIQRTQAGIDANALAATRLTSAYQQLVLAAADRKAELAANDDITRSLQFQISTLGQSNAAVAYAKEYQEVWNRGIENGATDLQELAAQAASAAGQVAGLTSVLTEAQAHSDLQFTVSLVGLSKVQQQAAQAARGAAGGNNAGADLATSQGQAELAKDQIADLQSQTAGIIASSVNKKQSLTDALNAVIGNPDAVKALGPDKLAALKGQVSQAISVLDTKKSLSAGASAANEDAKAYKRTTDALSLQLKALTETDRQKEIDEQLSRAKVSASSAEGKALADLTAKYYDHKQAITAANDAANFFGQTLESGFEGLITGGQSVTDVLGNIVKSLADAAIQAELLGQGPLAGLFGTAPAKSGTVGGILGTLFSALPKFGAGTNSAPGGLSLVGENGPELMNVPRGAQIIPAPQTRGLVAANQNSDQLAFQHTITLAWAQGSNGNIEPIVQSVATKTVRAHAPAIIGAAVKTSQKASQDWNREYQKNGAFG